MTDSRFGSADKGKSRQQNNAEGLSVSKAGSRRPGVETDHVPIRLRYQGHRLIEAAPSRAGELSPIVIELPLLELRRFLPQRLALELYQLAGNFFNQQERPPFPFTLAELRESRDLLATLRAQLPMIDNLITLITDPPAILMDEGPRLCFFKGLPIRLRPISFTFLFLLARSPGKFVTRAELYARLWPGEMDYDGSDKPYERQVTDHKYHLTAEIQKGMAGSRRLGKGEMERLFSTHYKQGYRLNLPVEEVLIFSKKDLLVFAFLLLFRRWFVALPSGLPFWNTII